MLQSLRPAPISLLCRSLLHDWLKFQRLDLTVTNEKADMKHLNFTSAHSLSSVAPYFTDSVKFDFHPKQQRQQQVLQEL